MINTLVVVVVMVVVVVVVVLGFKDVPLNPVAVGALAAQRSQNKAAVGLWSFGRHVAFSRKQSCWSCTS